MSHTSSSVETASLTTKLAYYGEFVIYPLLIAALSAWALQGASGHDALVWIGAFAGGVVFWTFVEYLLHRYILHHFPGIKEKHEDHHAHQRALIPTPLWQSLGIFALLTYLPLRLIFDPLMTAGLTGGLMLGYLWFEGVHHILHHWTIDNGHFFYRLKRRHMLHHNFDDKGNFGVVTGFWDIIFQTDVKTRSRKRAA